MQKSSHSADFEGTAKITCGPHSALVSDDTILIGRSGISATLHQLLNLSVVFKAGLYDTIKAKNCSFSVDLGD